MRLIKKILNAFGMGQYSSEEMQSRYEKETVALCNSGEYGKALARITELHEKKELSDEVTIKWGKICVEAYAVSLYSRSVKLYKERDYGAAIKCCVELRDLILKNFDMLGIENEIMLPVLEAWSSKIKNNPEIRASGLPHFKEELMAIARERCTDADKLANIKMLVDAMMLEQLAKSDCAD